MKRSTAAITRVKVRPNPHMSACEPAQEGTWIARLVTASSVGARMRPQRVHPVRRRCAGALTVLLALVADQALYAAPAAVKPLIDLPHSYYYREMYLPQLTSGPSASPGHRTRASWCTQWRARCGGRRLNSTQRAAAHGRPGLRLPARLVAGRTLHYLHRERGGGDGAVAP